MKPDDLDPWLVDDDAIVPSSGFTASVMEAVEREASMPPAIPFPWKRALPGLAVARRGSARDRGRAPRSSESGSPMTQYARWWIR